MSVNALYTDLSGYYDLMCVDIDYRAQSNAIHRLHQLFGNAGSQHLDLACGTGPHVRHFLDVGSTSSGLDIHQPMLDLAATRCPEAHFSLQDMGQFQVDEPVDLITCFLYSIHYNANLEKLSACIASAHRALRTGGVLCFNSVDKERIDNALRTRLPDHHPVGQRVWQCHLRVREARRLRYHLSRQLSWLGRCCCCTPIRKLRSIWSLHSR